MTQQQRFLMALIGTIGCLLLLSSCILFRSPKAKEVTIQNPPPTGSDYLACRVNGKPVVFQWAGTLMYPKFSYFAVKQDPQNPEQLLVRLVLRGADKISFGRWVELHLRHTFCIKDNLAEVDKSIFAEAKIDDAYYWIYAPSQLSPPVEPELEGTIKITDFKCEHDERGGYSGYISGVFSFTCNVLNPDTEEIFRYEITDGVFSVNHVK